jgi:hypothetical protein
MKLPKRSKDLWLMFSLLCFAGAPLLSLGMIVFLETPLANELQAEYKPHGDSGPGHFFAVGLIQVVRTAISFGILLLGLATATIGSIRIPRNAKGSIKLRDAAWVTFALSLVTLLMIAL